ncbi:hypothetical protein CTAYLR_009907 [Chrysophaeum taylorii]|uniref:NADH:ubiquinone oxidoreductase intermediate-associated protein 30 domain-containing protein n=1 Tax=Chrysophaeum taylorii TaxID=2483200 RepID=A0AAD7XK02_9STRA|nr:hypothetical protein CTAYLR_009907 [Chrysophaeum taylorii]
MAAATTFWERHVIPFARLFDGHPEKAPTRRVLFAFTERHRQWQRDVEATPSRPARAKITTDKGWGGRSWATFRVGRLGPGGGVGAVFEGETRRSASLLAERPPPTEKLGFAAVTLDLCGDEMICDDFEALTIRARPRDHRTYSVTLRGTALLAPDLNYQAFIKTRPSDTFVDLRCSFEHFVGLRGSRILDDNRVLDVPRFSAISIAVADTATDGPFRFELEVIHANNDPANPSPDNIVKPDGLPTPPRPF